MEYHSASQVTQDSLLYMPSTLPRVSSTVITLREEGKGLRDLDKSLWNSEPKWIFPTYELISQDFTIRTEKWLTYHLHLNDFSNNLSYLIPFSDLWKTAPSSWANVNKPESTLESLYRCRQEWLLHVYECTRLSVSECLCSTFILCFKVDDLYWTTFLAN